MVASVPEEVKRTLSTDGIDAAIRSAHSTSRRLPAPKWVPRCSCRSTASTTVGWAWPRSRAPWPMVKSTSSRPSTSHLRAPPARSTWMAGR
jgi:hypothetical protein